jgi:phage terminase Nu1 subunit (DNA packaging protein)
MTNRTDRTRSKNRDVRAAVKLLRERGLAPAELVALFDVSQSWCTRARSAGLPATRNGRHDPAAVLAWTRAREQEKPPPAIREDSPSLERWRAARADVAEIERELRRGQLLERSTVVDFAARAAQACRARMDAMVHTLGSMFGEEVRDSARLAVDDLCLFFERGMRRAAGDEPEGDGSAPDPAAAPATATGASSTADPAPATAPAVESEAP